MSIDIGADATDRALNASNAARTACYIEGTNPASVAGTIKRVFIYIKGTPNPVYVGIFTHAGSNVFSSRDYESVGALATGLNEKAVNLDVEIGDYIGLLLPIMASGDGIEIDVTGSADYWRTLEDTSFPYSSYTFDNLGGRIISLYGSFSFDYPTEGSGALAGLTRVTSIIHRYDRGVYNMELGLGDVISDFGIPRLDTGAEKSYKPKEEELFPEGATEEIERLVSKRLQFPTYEAQLAYERWFKQQMKELREMGYKG